jgi:hypothetical protein
MYSEFPPEYLKGRDHLKELGLDEEVVMKLVLKV